MGNMRFIHLIAREDLVDMIVQSSTHRGSPEGDQNALKWLEQVSRGLRWGHPYFRVIRSGTGSSIGSSGICESMRSDGTSTGIP